MSLKDIHPRKCLGPLGAPWRVCLLVAFLPLAAQSPNWLRPGYDLTVTTNEDNQSFEIRSATGLSTRVQSGDDLTETEGEAVLTMISNIQSVPGLRIRALRFVVEETIEGLVTPQSFVVDGTNILACLPTGIQIRWDKGMKFRAPMTVGRKRLTVDEPFKDPEHFAKRLKLAVEDPDRFIKQSTDAIALGLMKTRLASLQAEMEREKAAQVLQQAQSFSNLMEALLMVPDPGRREKYLRRALSITNPDLSRVFQARLYLQADQLDKARALIQGDDSPRAILVRLLVELRQGTAYVTNGIARWRELSWTTEEPVVGNIGLSFLTAEGGQVAAARSNYLKAKHLDASACADEFEISGTGRSGDEYFAMLRVADAFPQLAIPLLRPYYRTVEPPPSAISFTLLPTRNEAAVEAAVLSAALSELTVPAGKTNAAARTNRDGLAIAAAGYAAASGMKSPVADRIFIGWVDAKADGGTLEGVLSDSRTGKTLKTVRGVQWTRDNFQSVWTALGRDLLAALPKK